MAVLQAIQRGLHSAPHRHQAGEYGHVFADGPASLRRASNSAHSTQDFLQTTMIDVLPGRALSGIRESSAC
jgi:hypothetical protein